MAEATKEEYVYEQGTPSVVSPSMAVFEGLVEDIRYRGQLIARNQKLESGVGATGFTGFIIGFIAVLLLTLLPVIIKLRG